MQQGRREPYRPRPVRWAHGAPVFAVALVFVGGLARAASSDAPSPEQPPTLRQQLQQQSQQLQQAQPKQPPVVTVSLAQALDWAAGRAASVVLAEAGEREAQAARAGAGIVVPTNPRLYGEARRGAASQGSPGAGGGYAASLGVPFEVGGAPGARVKEVERRARVAGREVAWERFAARFSVWQTYVGLVLAEQRLQAWDETLAIAMRIEQASKLQAAVGSVSDIDVQAARASLAEYRAAREAALAEQAMLLFDLQQMCDLPAAAQVVLTTVVKGAPHCFGAALAESEQWFTKARERPDLAVTEARLDWLEASRTRLEREVFPKIEVVAGVDAAPDSAAFGQLGLAVELPFLQRNQGPRAVTAAMAQTESARLNLQYARLKREAYGRASMCEARQREAAVLAEQAVPAAERALALVEKGWKAGRFDIFRLTAAARDLARLRISRLDALEAAWQEHIGLAQTLGSQPEAMQRD